MNASHATRTRPSPQPTDGRMAVMDAIYRRRSVRNYSPEAVSGDLIRVLLDAAVHAPTAMHEEPCAFAVVQSRSLLDRISESAKEMALAEAKQLGGAQALHGAELLARPGYHVFYNAPALIVIYSKFQARFTQADCWLAAENLLLAACANHLASCVIGFAVPALNAPEWKAELLIPGHMVAVAPIIVGYAAGEPPFVPRKAPEVVAWV